MPWNRVVSWVAGGDGRGFRLRGAVLAASLASLSAVVVLWFAVRVPGPVLAAVVLVAVAVAGVAGWRRGDRGAIRADHRAMPAPAGDTVGGLAPAAAAAGWVPGTADDGPVPGGDPTDDGVRIELVDVDLGTGATSAVAPAPAPRRPPTRGAGGPLGVEGGPGRLTGTGAGTTRGEGTAGDGTAGDGDITPAVRRLAALVGRPDDAVVVLGADGRIRATSRGCTELWGVPTGRWVGRAFAGTLVAADMAPFQRFFAELLAAPAGTVASIVARATHAGGAVRRLELRAVADGDGAVVTARPVGERRTATTPLAAEDPLTGLATSAGLQHRCAAALERRRGDERAAVALLVLHLDDAAAVGAALGPLAADDLVVSVAERLQECLRSGDVAARLDDDRFAVLLEGRGAASAGAVADRLLELVLLPLRAGEVDVAVAGSVGLAAGRATSTSRSLLREAGAAAHSARDAGGRRVHRFEPPG